MIWDIFTQCGNYRDHDDPRGLFPLWMEQMKLDDHWCKRMCGWDEDAVHPYEGHSAKTVLPDLLLEFPQLEGLLKDEVGDNDWWVVFYCMLNMLALLRQHPKALCPSNQRTASRISSLM